MICIQGRRKKKSQVCGRNKSIGDNGVPLADLIGRYVSLCFWDVSKSDMHAVSDIGALVEWLQDHIIFGQDSADNLAVLYN